MRIFLYLCNRFSTPMRKLLVFIVLLGALCAHAETLLLRTGARLEGTIVFQNEEVVILRDATGARFQYPRAEVEQILSDEEVSAAKEMVAAEGWETDGQNGKKVSVLIELAGGAAFLPGENTGGAASADLLVGSHTVGGKLLFIGGGVGYHGAYMGAERYNFLPIQVALRMPFIETKHAPVFGLGLGYGVALSKDYLGGIYAALDLGYRCQVNPKTAIALTAFATFQQAQVPVITEIEGIEFTNRAGRNIVTSGLKLSLYF